MLGSIDSDQLRLILTLQAHFVLPDLGAKRTQIAWAAFADRLRESK